MKKSIVNLFFICLIMITGIAHAKNEVDNNSVILSNPEDLIFKTENGEEIVYDKNNLPYSGAVILPDEAKRYITYIYVDGKKNGVAISRFVTGKIELETTYANGKKNGDEILFYFNEKPKYKRTYHDDLLDGDEFLYHQNGQIKQISHYNDGKLNGTVTYFNENGEPIKTETYVAGLKNGLTRIIEKNILREEIPYVNGKREGIYKTYSSEGSRREITFKNDKKEGEGRIYSPNNILLESVVYANDKRNGLYQKYSLNGKLLSSENYKDDLKDGISRHFDSNGNLVSVNYYIDGVELGNVQVAKRVDISNIQDALSDKRINRYSNKKNLWFKILWLGLNLNDTNLLNRLEKEMKMYAVDMSDIRIYQRWSGSQFESEKNQLFFGLSPLDYAINIEAPAEILQKLVTEDDEPNSRGFTALRDAVRLNKTDMVKFLLLNGANLKETDSDGNDILLYSIVSDSPIEMIENIIKSGGDVNTVNKLGQTPITVALAQKNADLVKLLILAGADINNIPDGQNILHFAYSKKAPIELMEALIDSGISINSTDTEGNNLLLKALKNNDEQTALFALENGADINQRDNEGETPVSYVLFNKVAPQVKDTIFSLEYDVNSKLEKQNTTIWKALMEQNDLDLLKKVWDKMPDISINPDAMGEYPLKAALNVPENRELRELALSYIKNADDNLVWETVKDKNAELLKYLVSKNANVNSKNESGESLLIYMVQNNYDKQFIDIIKTESLNINDTNSNMKTALDIAIDNNNAELAEYLLQAGAALNNNTGGYVFITGAKPSQDKMVRLLLKYMPQIDMSLPENASLLTNAVKNLNLPLFEYLIAQQNPDYTVTDENGNSLLLSSADYFAIADDNDDEYILRNNFMDIVKTLLNNGLDINMRNYNGETLLIKLAQNCHKGYEDLAKFMIDHGADAQARDQYNKTADDYRQNEG